MVWGQTGICLAAEYLLDFYSAVRLLLESWKKASETGACDFSVGSSDHWGDVCVYVLYRGLFMTFLGFPDPGFFSGDYFPLFPWIFLYLTGYFLYGMFMKFPEVKNALRIHLPVPFLEAAGRHSLLLYLLHQPLLMLVFTAADVLKIL